MVTAGGKQTQAGSCGTGRTYCSLPSPGSPTWPRVFHPHQFLEDGNSGLSTLCPLLSGSGLQHHGSSLVLTMAESLSYHKKNESQWLCPLKIIPGYSPWEVVSVLDELVLSPEVKADTLRALTALGEPVKESTPRHSPACLSPSIRKASPSEWKGEEPALAARSLMSGPAYLISLCGFAQIPNPL